MTIKTVRKMENNSLAVNPNEILKVQIINRISGKTTLTYYSQIPAELSAGEIISKDVAGMNTMANKWDTIQNEDGSFSIPVRIDGGYKISIVEVK